MSEDNSGSSEEPRKRKPAPNRTDRLRAQLARERKKNRELVDLVGQARQAEAVSQSEQVTVGTATYDGVTYRDGEPVQRAPVVDHKQLAEMFREQQLRWSFRHYSRAQLEDVRRHMIRTGHGQSRAVELLDEHLGMGASYAQQAD